MKRDRKPDEVHDDGSVRREVFKRPDGKIDMNVLCSRCGKPITVSNKYGMFCEDLCGLEESKRAGREISKAFGGLFDGILGEDE